MSSINEHLSYTRPLAHKLWGSISWFKTTEKICLVTFANYTVTSPVFFTCFSHLSFSLSYVNCPLVLSLTFFLLSNALYALQIITVILPTFFFQTEPACMNYEQQVISLCSLTRTENFPVLFDFWSKFENN